jgi:hypothetical protein
MVLYSLSLSLFMKPSSRKGQGAMEYLMTYGWAILVVMIVGITLWQMGVFSHLSKTISRCNDFDAVKCFDPSVMYKGGSSQSINATFTNGLGTPIILTSIKANEDCVYTTADNALVAGGSPNMVIQPGGLIRFSCPNGGVGSLKNPNKPVGDPFTVLVNITYQETVAGKPITRTEQGRLKGFVE